MRPDLPAVLVELVERLLAKDPAARFATPQALLQAVADVEAVVAPGRREVESPLVWGEADAEFFDPQLRAGWQAAAGDQGAPGLRSRLNQATVGLEAIERELRERTLERRQFWGLVAAAAAVALAAGFAIGRSRPRRSSLFNPRR